MSHKHITIVGNVGAGKSTLTQIIADRLPAKKVPADSLFKVNPFFPLAVQDRARWSLTSDIWFLYERVKMARQIPELLKTSPVVVDSGLPMSYVYAHSRLGSGYFTHDEWDLYRSVYKELVKKEYLPDQVIYLQAPIDFLRQRIEERGREFEIKYHTREYLQSLDESIVETVAYLRDMDVPIIDIDVTQTDFLHNTDEVESLFTTLVVNTFKDVA